MKRRKQILVGLTLVVCVAAAWLAIKWMMRPALEMQPNFTINLGDGVTLEMIWIPGGTFQMGSRMTPEELAQKFEDKAEYYLGEWPVHTVTLDGFWMGKCEVTNAQYRRFKSSRRSQDFKNHRLDGDTQPVTYISWKDSKAFCNWLSQKNGESYRLPTEAEWEYACRAGTTSVRYWGDNNASMGQYANTHDRTGKQAFNFSWAAAETTDGHKVTAPIGRFTPNAFGLYDMIGNVWEWCEDWYDKEYYGKSPSRNPLNSQPGKSRVMRGGSWSDEPKCCRSACRNGGTPGSAVSNNGFRIVRTPK